MNTFPPSHFAGWIPKLQYDYHKKWNEEWATDERFEQLGNTFAGFLQNGVSHLTNQHRILEGIGGGKRHKLGDSGLFITGNAPMVRGSYTYKRFVRIGSEGYHPNAVQMFIECYTGGTPFDASPRDDSDLDYDRMGFPIEQGNLGVFVGMSAIKDYSKKGSKNWCMMARELDDELIKSDFRELDDAVLKAGVWARDFVQDPKMVKVVRTNNRVSRLRIKLPNQPEDAADWEICQLEESLNGIVSHFGQLFVEMSRL